MLILPRLLSIVFVSGLLVNVILILARVIPELPQQQVLGSGSEGGEGGSGYGLLRRFKASDIRLQEVLQIAQDDQLDIWQATPDHVDIYFPAPTSPSSSYSRIIAYPHSSTPIPIPSPSSPSYPQTKVQTNPPTNWTSLPPLSSPYHTSYHPLFEIDSFLYALEREHPELVEVFRVGISGEGRDLLGVKISKGVKGGIGVGKKAGGKMGFVITGAQHAREWIATATSLYLTHALVAHSNPHPIPNTNTTDDLSPTPINLHALLDKFDFYIIPAPNPDGYDYTWESDRFWYKNRMKTGAGSKCVGVDMNRNWGYKWRSTVSLTTSQNASEPNPTKKSRHQTPNPPGDHPCSQWYPGSRPFQAPEVNHIASFVETLPNLKAFVDLRSYGQMLSSPFSFTCWRLPNDAENQLEAALGAVSALRKPYGTMFNTGSLCSTFYRAHGNIVDWMYKSAGIKYSYAAHLRDTGTYGFALPPHLIRPVGEETAHMIEYLANFIAHVEK